MARNMDRWLGTHSTVHTNEKDLDILGMSVLLLSYIHKKTTLKSGIRRQKILTKNCIKMFLRPTLSLWHFDRLQCAI